MREPRDANVRRNLDVFTSADEIAAGERHFGMQDAKFTVIHSLVPHVSPKAKVADIGCFTRIGSVSYLEYDDVDEVHVFDASDVLLDIAAAKGLKPHRWICGDEPAPVADDSYDMVVASDIIEHVLDTDFLVQELMRITTPGGHILITTPNLGWWVNRVRLLAGKAPVSFPGVSSRFKKDEMIDLNHLRINITDEWHAFFVHHSLELIAVRGYRLNMGMRWFLRPIERVITNPGLTFGICFLMKVPVTVRAGP